MRGEVLRAGRREVAGDGDARSVQGRVRLSADRGQTTRGAYQEHVAHVFDAERVEGQRLVELPCVLPSRKEGIRCGTRCGPGDERAKYKADRRAAGDGGACKGRAGDGPTADRGQTTRGAYQEHVAHVFDAGRVEGQRLVELPCVLPSRKEGTRCGTRCGPGDERAAVQAGACREGPDYIIVGAAWEECTYNIQLMSLTLDVSRVSGWLNALAPCRDSKGGHTIRGDMRAGGW